MERILRGIMRYRHTTREQMVKEFQKVRDNPQVSKILISYGSKILKIATNTQYCFMFFHHILHIFSNHFTEMSCSRFAYTHKPSLFAQWPIELRTTEMNLKACVLSLRILCLWMCFTTECITSHPSSKACAFCF